VGTYRKGQRVTVATTTIQRTNGAAWRGDAGVVVAESGDGYTVRFDNGFVADRVADRDIRQA
jgi:ribosomal protein L21E